MSYPGVRVFEGGVGKTVVKDVVPQASGLSRGTCDRRKFVLISLTSEGTPRFLFALIPS